MILTNDGGSLGESSVRLLLVPIQRVDLSVKSICLNSLPFIADEKGYVAFAEPIARDAGFYGALADALSENLVKDSTLPSNLQPVAKQAIVRIANQVSDQPGFVTAWNDTQRQSHQIMLGDQKDLPAELNSSSGFAIDPLRGRVS